MLRWVFRKKRHKIGEELLKKAKILFFLLSHFLPYKHKVEEKQKTQE